MIATLLPGNRNPRLEVGGARLEDEERGILHALNRAGRDWEMVFTAASSISVAGAVAAGLGVSAMIERVVPPEVTVWRDAPLPPLPDVVCAIYLREGDNRELLEDLAEAFVTVIRSRPGRTVSRETMADRQAS